MDWLAPTCGTVARHDGVHICGSNWVLRMMLARSHHTQSTILPCSSLTSSCWTTMRRISLEGWYQQNMLRMFWSIAMAALSGVGGRRSSSNLPSQCCLLSFPSIIKWFSTMSYVTTTVTNFPFWKALWNLSAYERPKSSRAMEPFCFWKTLGLRLRPLQYLGAKKRRSCLVVISSVVSINLVRSFFLLVITYCSFAIVMRVIH